jgi:hypothetical protein
VTQPAELAVAVLTGLVEHWVKQGKDPHVEAVRIAGIEGAVAAVDAEIDAEIARMPKRPVPGSGL